MGTIESRRSIRSEWDDGKEIYEGSIFYEGKEYDFEIDGFFHIPIRLKKYISLLKLQYCQYLLTSISRKSELFQN